VEARARRQEFMGDRPATSRVIMRIPTASRTERKAGGSR
jgi:hypothetical protein